ncbi:thioesterase family protein [Polyangium jinanense]|uniref:Thioesterase family protein n=1 Tax=Polyangium jinanense TaxID=2829994 RepID=A0A9X4AUC9_9BACT|nr:thioesterase family protein [Polyangium jinanense]MDC3958570.1 thioesterase family protein [Polyangium jinanense]MDC3983122.1 thioesterase family protein [Polyangium jinanense]
MVDFVALTTPRVVAPGRCSLDVPDGWQQGRGAFGGFCLAVLVRAIESMEDDAERSLRSLTAELCGPLLAGPAEVLVEVLRRGSGMTTVAARIVQEGTVISHAVGILARSRTDTTTLRTITPPRPTPWNDVAPLPSQEWPTFAKFFEYRVTGPLPFSGHSSPVTETWVRLRPPCPRLDAAYLTALADATWPASFSVMPEPRPVGTVSFTLQLFPPFDRVKPDAPLYHRGQVLVAADGYAVERRELWTEDGELLALNHQTIATIR